MQILSRCAAAGIGRTSIDVQPPKIDRILAQQPVRLKNNPYFTITLPVFSVSQLDSS
jgi:hypothetical protein